MEIIANKVSAQRQEAYRNAVDLVERNCDDVVKQSLLKLTRYYRTLPLVGQGEGSLKSGLEHRLRRLFLGYCQTDKGQRILDGSITMALRELPEKVQSETICPEDTNGKNVSWPYWLKCYRRILDLLAPHFGKPGYIYTVSVTVRLLSER
jgi:hypothetical protein